MYQESTSKVRSWKRRHDQARSQSLGGVMISSGVKRPSSPARPYRTAASKENWVPGGGGSQLAFGVAFCSVTDAARWAVPSAFSFLPHLSNAGLESVVARSLRTDVSQVNSVRVQKAGEYGPVVLREEISGNLKCWGR